MEGQTKYKTARLMAGMTQDQAVEKLYTSISNLKRIERGTQKCSPDLEEAMAKVYGAPWVADHTVPIDYSPLPKTQAALRYIKERTDVNKVMDRATEILADGIVDESEQDDFSNITKQIQEELDAGRDLLYAS